MTLFLKIALLCVLVLLGACSNAAPKVAAQAQANSQNRNYHVVQKGETIYSIAFVYGLDYHALARWNDLDAAYHIWPDQKLRLTVDTIVEKTIKRQINDENVNKSSQSSAVGMRQAAEIEPSPGRQANKFPPSPVPNAAQPKSASTSLSDSAKSAASDSKNVEINPANGPIRWSWPCAGRVLQNFSPLVAGNKGLNIAGKNGEPVHAAASGRVVYAGSGLRGFGQLIILKHNDDFLSAYAHNSVLRVKENEVVKAGQIIADIGSSGTDREQLHFEIRYQGAPVDPLKHLPKR